MLFLGDEMNEKRKVWLLKSFLDKIVARGNSKANLGIQLKRAFEKFDRDGSGELDLEEFRLAMEEHLPGIDENEFVALARSFDKNGDEVISIKEFIDKERLCSKCLRKGHLQPHCEINILCQVCHQQHATCLHNIQNKHNSKPPTHSALSNRISVGQHQGLTSMIVPVYVSTDGRPENEVMVYALIDSQSDTSFIDESIPNSWEEDFKTVKLEISTVTTQKKIVDCLSIQELYVRGIYSDEPITIPQTYSQDNIPGKRSIFLHQTLPGDGNTCMK